MGKVNKHVVVWADLTAYLCQHNHTVLVFGPHFHHPIWGTWTRMAAPAGDNGPTQVVCGSCDAAIKKVAKTAGDLDAILAMVMIGGLHAVQDAKCRTLYRAHLRRMDCERFEHLIPACPWWPSGTWR